MGERARRLADDLKADTLSGPARALADEAVLIVERLEQLDAVLQGDPAAWLRIAERMPEVGELVINAPLAEVRQQGLALKSILAELGKLTDAVPVAPPVSAADELKKKREARRREAAQG